MLRGLLACLVAMSSLVWGQERPPNTWEVGLFSGKAHHEEFGRGYGVDVSWNFLQHHAISWRITASLGYVGSGPGLRETGLHAVQPPSTYRECAWLTRAHGIQVTGGAEWKMPLLPRKRAYFLLGPAWIASQGRSDSETNHFNMSEPERKPVSSKRFSNVALMVNVGLGARISERVSIEGRVQCPIPFIGATHGMGDSHYNNGWQPVPPVLALVSIRQRL